MRALSSGRIAALGALLVLCILLRFLVGYRLGWPQDATVRALRLASIAASIGVGANLAISGVMLQSLLRNALASPYILGLAAGAALGVGTVQLLGARFDAISWLTQPVAAAAGSLLALLLVYRLSLRRGFIDPMTMLLVGVMISVIASALLMLIQFLMGPGADQLLRWMMGRIAPETPWSMVATCGLAAAAGLALGLKWSSALDSATLSDDEAISVGVNLPALRVRMFVIAGVLTALSVLVAGPIGFVGLIAPHAARLMIGPAHAGLLIGAAVLGASLLLAADSAVQILPHIPFSPLQRGLLPVGILTSAIGGPVFICILRRRGGWSS